MANSAKTHAVNASGSEPFVSAWATHDTFVKLRAQTSSKYEVTAEATSMRFTAFETCPAVCDICLAYARSK